ncbi:hypothetical protein G7Y89_g9776 [Cudoniella acicularis]|uniref:Mitochondrial pyruvate carrier n=1 Tax=Cudoniella acicularis TaxID=354080 RepID=A0A8H4W1K2_9HELO|nr:hypothetical protein G7Y89_g9776 [Cudoniella acicularis]
MPPASHLLRAARPAFRAQANTFFTSQAARSQFRSKFAGKRWQSTAAPTAGQQVSWFKRMWDSPIGLKTVHFWAPVMKWAIVLAGVADFARPAEKLSLTQNAALTATGMIWTRWCLIIKPRNVLLASVNFMLGIVGIIQVSRILIYNYTQKDKTTAQQVEAAKDSVVESAEGIKKEAAAAVKSS